jgi:hypothetical protein
MNKKYLSVVGIIAGALALNHLSKKGSKGLSDWGSYEKKIINKIKEFDKYNLKYSKMEKSNIDILEKEIMMGNDSIYTWRQIIQIYFYIAKKYYDKILLKDGWKLHYKSKSSIYYIKNDDIIRISDHELPDTEQRRYNSKMGVYNGSNIEIIVDDIYSPKELSNILTDELKWL